MTAHPLPDGLAAPRRIVVGFDGSEPAVRALRTALGLAVRLSAHLWVVHATGPSPGVAEPLTDEQDDRERGAVEEALRGWGPVAAARQVALDLRLEEGPPAPTIVRIADEVGADLIVVGTRGRRADGTPRTLGSVAVHVVASARRPVLVVP